MSGDKFFQWYLDAPNHLSPGDPTTWNEEIGCYETDRSDNPEHWTYYLDDEDDLRVYPDGVIEAYNNEPITIEELERRAIGVLSALKKAYRILESNNN